MTEISQNFQKLLEPGLRKIFMDEYNKAPDMVAMFYAISGSNKAVEHDLGIVGGGEIPEFNGTLAYSDHTQGYEVNYTHKEFARGESVERKLYDDDQYGIMNRRIMGLALDAYKTRQKHGASPLNHAFDTTVFTGGDGLALCSASHTSPNAALQGVQSNLGTSALGVTALNAARQAMMNFKGDDGEPANIVPDMLIVPVGKGELAIEICKSANQINTGNNNLNANNAGLPGYQIQPVIWNQLTNSDNWFLVDSRMMKRFLLWFDRIPVEFNEAENFDGLVAKYNAYMRYSFGFSDWRFIYGSNVA